MAKMTRKEMLKLWLEGTYSAKDIPSKNKYDMMEGIGKDGAVIYFFLGSNGALRTGRTKTASKSLSWTHGINIENLEKWLDQRGLLK